jgi:hypothetical protein
MRSASSLDGGVDAAPACSSWCAPDSVGPQRGIEDLHAVLVWSLPGLPHPILEVVDRTDDLGLLSTCWNTR